MIKVFEYRSCDSCRKARRFLEAHKIAHELIPITEKPPSVSELRAMLHKHQASDIKKLFNSSGQDYRRLNMKERLATLTEDEALKLLAANGKLIKRPFVLGDGIGVLGFREENWQELFL